MQLHPEVESYKLYYAQVWEHLMCIIIFMAIPFLQSQYKASSYQEAMKASCRIEKPSYQAKVSLELRV